MYVFYPQIHLLGPSVVVHVLCPGAVGELSHSVGGWARINDEVGGGAAVRCLDIDVRCEDALDQLLILDRAAVLQSDQRLRRARDTRPVVPMEVGQRRDALARAVSGCVVEDVVGYLGWNHKESGVGGAEGVGFVDVCYAPHIVIEQTLSSEFAVRVVE